MRNPEKDWFGEKKVSPDKKAGLVHDVFESVAPKYDIMNDLMSAGMHRLWKDRLVRMIRPRPGLSYLDVAGGTGDIAFRIKKYLENPSPSPLRGAPPSPLRERVIRANGEDRVRAGKITICDINEHMLDAGRDRATDRGWLDDFEWVTGNAESLPFPDASFDVHTIAFGLRNVTHIDDALKEAFRVLKPGGKYFCLEFSHVGQPLLSKAYDLYSRTVIPKIGRMVANDEASYQYLIESIRKFPPQKQLARRMTDSGFKNVKYANLSAGIVAIHQGVKP